MTEHIEQERKFFVQDKQQKQYRKEPEDKYRFAVRYQAQQLDDVERSVHRLEDMLQEETPVVFPWEKITLIRTVPTVPEIYTEEEAKEIAAHHYIHEQGKVCNISPEYSLLLDRGLLDVREETVRQEGEFRAAGETKKADYERALTETIDAVLAFAERYRQEALRVGNTVVANTLAQVPAKRPRTLLEALQFLRIIHYCLWCSYNYHNTLGRFDQYMYPYYRHDVDAGILDRDGALELIEEFFLSLNRDSDLYTGMQQGDNGQSMVLGGLNLDGSDSYNDLSDLCLLASLELKLIDPKINLRVNRKTPLWQYVRGTELTKQGLGFPQYSNDDVVIKALKHWGYEEKDAYNYAVAACWEFIIPGRGMDIPNLNSLSFPACADKAIDRLEEFDTFDALMDEVKRNIFAASEKMRAAVHDIYMEPAPLLSLLMEGTVANARDISLGNRYNNYGFHGTGLSTAVDSLAAVRKYVYEDKSVSKADLLHAIHDDFSDAGRGESELCNMLRYEAPKMGNDDNEADEIATQLLDWYADSMEGHVNDRGGIYRVGTGSAMYYIWQSKDEPASADGRHKGEEFAANYSPSLFTRLNGPVSIIKSFAKPHLYRVANGGPLTIELSDTMFRNEESVTKTAMFVKTFIDLGGLQLQINSVNREELLDAKAHPENHRNLIVRVWGWSGYFVELDECYQNHILKRMELTV